MTREEAIKKLEAEKNRVCMGCMHPQQVGWCEEYCCLPEAYQMAIETLKAEPIKHGRWIMKQHLLFHQQLPYCSECGKTGIFVYDYCPHCGAKMDLDEVKE